MGGLWEHEWWPELLLVGLAVSWGIVALALHRVGWVWLAGLLVLAVELLGFFWLHSRRVTAKLLGLHEGIANLNCLVHQTAGHLHLRIHKTPRDALHAAAHALHDAVSDPPEENDRFVCACRHSGVFGAATFGTSAGGEEEKARKEAYDNFLGCVKADGWKVRMLYAIADGPSLDRLVAWLGGLPRDGPADVVAKVLARRRQGPALSVLVAAGRVTVVGFEVGFEDPEREPRPLELGVTIDGKEPAEFFKKWFDEVWRDEEAKTVYHSKRGVVESVVNEVRARLSPPKVVRGLV